MLEGSEFFKSAKNIMKNYHFTLILPQFGKKQKNTSHVC